MTSGKAFLVQEQTIRTAVEVQRVGLPKLRHPREILPALARLASSSAGLILMD
jgi:hypothetical protein